MQVIFQACVIVVDNNGGFDIVKPPPIFGGILSPHAASSTHLLCVSVEAKKVLVIGAEVERHFISVLPTQISEPKTEDVQLEVTLLLTLLL